MCRGRAVRCSHAQPASGAHLEAVPAQLQQLPARVPRRPPRCVSLPNQLLQRPAQPAQLGRAGAQALHCHRQQPAAGVPPILDHSCSRGENWCRHETAAVHAPLLLCLQPAAMWPAASPIWSMPVHAIGIDAFGAPAGSPQVQLPCWQAYRRPVPSGARKARSHVSGSTAVATCAAAASSWALLSFRTWLSSCVQAPAGRAQRQEASTRQRKAWQGPPAGKLAAPRWQEPAGESSLQRAAPASSSGGRRGAVAGLPRSLPAPPAHRCLPLHRLQQLRQLAHCCNRGQALGQLQLHFDQAAGGGYVLQSPHRLLACGQGARHPAQRLLEVRAGGLVHATAVLMREAAAGQRAVAWRCSQPEQRTHRWSGPVRRGSP